MRGLKRMIAIVTTGMAALMCQGCATHTTAPAFAEPAVAPSVGMLLATGQGRDGRAEGLSITVQASSLPSVQRSISSMSMPIAAIGPVNTPRLEPAFAPTRSTFASVAPGQKRPIVGFDGVETSTIGVLQQFSAGVTASRLSPSYEVARNFGGELSLSAPAELTGLPVDVGFSPRASIREEGGLTSRRFGGEIRLGDGLDERGEASSARSWYIFAGADGEALCWDVGEKGFTTNNSLRLRDQVTVGDMQAGVSVNAGVGQLSFSYIRREVEYRDRSAARASETEDFAGVSFTIRR